MSRFLVTGIEWDTDGIDPVELGLPDAIDVEADDEDDISGVLSDSWGWCILSIGNVVAA